MLYNIDYKHVPMKNSAIPFQPSFIGFIFMNNPMLHDLKNNCKFHTSTKPTNICLKVESAVVFSFEVFAILVLIVHCNTYIRLNIRNCG